MPIDDLTLGQYSPGESLLHSLDPRLKLAGTLLLVVAVFSGSAPGRLLLLGATALVLAALSRVGVQRWWRGLRAFRRFFLFTIVLHLFFSPGRTLFGVEWLSLDGLMRGIVVCAQMGLALVFSSLLTYTTTPEEIAAAFVRLCAPLRRLGVPVEEGGRLLLLILHFTPHLREEAAAALSVARSNRGEEVSGLQGRLRLLREAIPPLVLRLIDRADALAHACARGEKIPGEGIVLPPLRPRGLFFVAGSALLFICLIGVL